MKKDSRFASSRPPFNQRESLSASLDEREPDEIEENFNYQIIDNEPTREAIKQRMSHLVSLIDSRGIDNLVFLDRSARPLAWMFRDIWQALYPEKQIPDIKFANIGGPSSHSRGELGYIGSIDDGMSPSRETEVYSQSKEVVARAVEKDDWIEMDDLPVEWREGLARETGAIDTIRKTYKDGFDEKTSLIIDELGCTGRTLMMSLAFFELAFPDTNGWHATSFFLSKKNSVGESKVDKDQLPWFGEDGIAGILELPYAESFLSAPLTQENADKIIEVLERKNAYEESGYRLRQELFVRDIKASIRPTTDLDTQFKHFLESLPPGNLDDSIHKLSELLSEEMNLYRSFDELDSFDDFDLNRHRELRAAIRGVAKDEIKIKFSDSHIQTDFDQSTYRSLADLYLKWERLDPPIIPRRSQSNLSTKKEIATYEDVSTLRELSLQLRSEMKQLAKEAAQEESNEHAPAPIQQ